MYLVGWKAMAAFLGIHVRTLRTWHYSYLKVPIIKDSISQQSRCRITIPTLNLWYRQVRKFRHELAELELEAEEENDS